MQLGLLSLIPRMKQIQQAGEIAQWKHVRVEKGRQKNIVRNNQYEQHKPQGGIRPCRQWELRVLS